MPGRAVPAAFQPSNHQKNMGSAAQPTSAQHSAPLQTSSVAKSLFAPLPPPAHSSPYTPQQQDQPAAAYPSATPACAVAQQEIGPSQCSIVSSSKTLIVSPLKGSAYYAVERSYHLSSPLKPTARSSPLKPTTRKLNFDCTELGPCEQICDKASASASSDEDKQYDFDMDFTNFDICDGEFSFSELLLDFDLDNEGVLNASTSDQVQRYRHTCSISMSDAFRFLVTVHAKSCSLCMLNKCRLEPAAAAASGHMAAGPVLPDSVKPVAADSAQELNPQGCDHSLIRSPDGNLRYIITDQNPFLKQERPLLLLSGLLLRG